MHVCMCALIRTALEGMSLFPPSLSLSLCCVQLGEQLKLGVQSLGEALATHLAVLGTALSEDDPKTRKDLANSTKAVKEKVHTV